MAKKKKKEKKFTIDEISEYFRGWCIVLPGGVIDIPPSLHNALVQIEDEQDGIAAVTKRQKKNAKIQQKLWQEYRMKITTKKQK